MKKKGAEIVWECLTREGVEVVFGYPGGANMPIYDAMLSYPVHHVLVRHEQGAAFMADVYGRLTGRAGATTVAELTVCRKPSILVPFPHAKDNHQRHNAQSLTSVGAAVLGMVLFDEPRDIVRVLCIALIIAGIAGLKIVSPQ